MTECEGVGNADILEIAPKCAACPEQMSLAKVYFRLGHTAFHLQEVGEELVGEPGKEFDEMIADAFPEELANVISQIARRSLGRELDDIDHDKDQLKEESQAMSRSCDGVLKLRGARNGTEYTVAICGSARTYLHGSDEPNETPANVWIRSKQ